VANKKKANEEAIKFPVLNIGDYSKTKPNVQSWTIPETGKYAGIVQARVTLKVTEKLNGWKRLDKKFSWSYVAHDAFVQGQGEDKLETWGNDGENYKIGGRYWDTEGLWLIVKVKASYTKDGMVKGLSHAVKCSEFGSGVMRMDIIDIDDNGNLEDGAVVSLGAKKVLEKIRIVEDFVRRSIERSDKIHREILDTCRFTSEISKESLKNTTKTLYQDSQNGSEVFFGDRMKTLFKEPFSFNKVVEISILLFAAIGVVLLATTVFT